jgi:hypothetical protein
MAPGAVETLTQILLRGEPVQIGLGRQRWQNLLHGREPTIECFEYPLHLVCCHRAGSPDNFANPA